MAVADEGEAGVVLTVRKHRATAIMGQRRVHRERHAWVTRKAVMAFIVHAEKIPGRQHLNIDIRSRRQPWRNDHAGIVADA